MHYSKYGLFHLLTIVSIVAAILWGDAIYWAYAATTLFITFGDALLGDDTSTPEYQYKAILDGLLFAALPLTFVLFIVSMWYQSSADPFGLGQWVQNSLNYDMFAARANSSFAHTVVAVLYLGLMISTMATVTAHELIHRTWSPISVCCGRWLLALSFDANFAIEHVYGHHKHVATPTDPATAPRGRNVYQHIFYSTWHGNVSAWRIERARLARLGFGAFSWRNLCLRGYAMSLMIMAMALFMSGLSGLMFFVCVGLVAKAMLEIVNYMEHYGLVRVPNKRVEPRHSWNTNRKVSSWALFNLARHSHHHAHGQLAFYKLKPFSQSPQMISGYLATMALTLIPPLWFKLMKKPLEDWDNHFASTEERAILDHEK